MEFQIPNVHPIRQKKEYAVKYDGKEQVESFGQTVTADAYSWKFTIEHTRAFTTGTGENVSLVAWESNVSTAGVHAKIQFKNFATPTKEQMPAFLSQFHPPPTSGPDRCTIKCDDLRKQGKLRSYPKAWGARAASAWPAMQQ